MKGGRKGKLYKRNSTKHSAKEVRPATRAGFISETQHDFWQVF